MALTPAGMKLQELVRNYGWSEFTVEKIDEETGISYDCHDLGNGNMVYGFISQMTDEINAVPGEPIDLASANFGDWDNLSSQYTGQFGGADTMHDSEFLGGRLVDNVAAQVGEYAMPMIAWLCDEDCEECEGEGVGPHGAYCETQYEGWLMLHRDIFKDS